MPRKTLALISGLVLVTIVLFIVALRAGQQPKEQAVKQTQPSNTAQQQPVPTIPAHTVLGMSPNPLSIGAGQQGSVDVTIDTSDNDVTAVQLEIGYDPNFVSNVKVSSGALFPNAVVLIDKNDAQSGRYTYAVGITPSNQPIKGQGTVAKITFTAKSGKVGDTQLGLLPSSLVTARGVAESVMKSASGTVINIGAASQGSSTGMTQQAPKTSSIAPTQTAR